MNEYTPQYVREPALIGTLPHGVWQFLRAGTLLMVVDTSGKHAPRIVKRDKLITLEAVEGVDGVANGGAIRGGAGDEPA